MIKTDAIKIKAIFVFLIFLLSGIIIFISPSPQINIVEAKSIWQTSNNDFQNGTLNQTIVFPTENDGGLKLAPGKWFYENPIIKPNGMKRGAMASIYGTDKALIFGENSQTWIYDLSDNSWASKGTSQVPSQRDDIKISTIYGTDKVLLFGGRKSDNFYNDTWIYDLSNESWTDLSLSNKPSPRNLHSMTPIYNDDKILLYGGFHWGTGSNYFNDTWIFDLSENKWTQQFPINTPRAKARHAITSIYGTDKVILYGGGNENDHYLNETWIYDLSDNSWINVKSNYQPSGRHDLGMAFIHGTGKVLLFGGFKLTNEYLNDTWIFDHNEKLWTEVKLQNFPPGREAPYMSTIHNTDKILLYGSYDGHKYLNDTWLFSYNKFVNYGTYISAAWNTGRNSSFKEIKWNADIPNNCFLKFQIRTSNNSEMLLYEKFVGPNGTSDSFYVSTPSNIWLGHYGNQWVQYKVFLATNDDEFSPALKEVLITYNNLPKTILSEPTNENISSINQPIFKWIFYDISSNIQTGFQVIIDDDMDFSSIDYDSGIQFLTDNQWKFPDGTNYKTISDGTWYWKARTRDDEGDWSEYSSLSLFHIDTLSPNSTIIEPKNNHFYNSLDAISGIASDMEGGIGVNKVEIKIKRLNDDYYWSGNNWIQNDVWLTVVGTTNWSYDVKSINWNSDTQYMVYSRAIDKIFNIENQGIGNTFSIDKDKPISTINYPQDNSFLTKSETIYGIAEDLNGSGIQKVEIRLRRTSDNKYWSGTNWVAKEVWLEAEGNYSWLWNVTNVIWTNGITYIAHSRANDELNNSENVGKGITFMYDDQPPIKSIIINNNEDFTNSTQVLFSLDASDSGSGVSQMRFGIDNNTWSQWEFFKEKKIFNLSQGDGNKNIYFQVKDKANNNGDSMYDSIILDTEPPEKLSIIINNNEPRTDSIFISLKLNAYDTTSGLDKMAFSIDGNIWSDWVDFNYTKSYQLPSGDGEKIIYMKVSDNAGNAAEPISTTIMLKTIKDSSNEKLAIDNLYIIASMIVIIIILILILSYLHFKRKEKRLEEDKKVLTPNGMHVPPKSSQEISGVQPPPEYSGRAPYTAVLQDHAQRQTVSPSTESALVQGQPFPIPHGAPITPIPRIGADTTDQQLPQLPQSQEALDSINNQPTDRASNNEVQPQLMLSQTTETSKSAKIDELFEFKGENGNIILKKKRGT